MKRIISFFMIMTLTLFVPSVCLANNVTTCETLTGEQVQGKVVFRIYYGASVNNNITSRSATGRTCFYYDSTQSGNYDWCLAVPNGSKLNVYESYNNSNGLIDNQSGSTYLYKFLEQDLFDAENDNVAKVYLGVPVFKDKATGLEYINTGKITDTSQVRYMPDGYSIDENGNLIKTPVKEELGIPLDFKFYFPRMYGDITDKASWLGSVSNTDNNNFMAIWKNTDDKLGYKCQIQYKGKYQAKKWLFAPTEIITTDYIDIGLLGMEKCKFSKPENELDYDDTNQSPLMKNIIEKFGFTPGIGTMLKLEGHMRIRYVKYDSSGNVVSYGRWAQSNIVGNTDPQMDTVEVDENGNEVNSPEYGDGVENTLDDYQEISNDTNANKIAGVTNDVTAITDNLGQVPQMLSELMGFMPSEIWVLFATGISLLIGIAIIKALL